MMKYLFSFSLLLALIAGCRQTPAERYEADLKLTEAERTELLQSVVRYMGKMPGNIGPDDRFDPQYDPHYAKQAEEHRVDLYHEAAATGDIYFMASRIAPSMYVKRVGIGVHMRREGEKIAHYEEVFRTWKMTEEELAEKGALLFGKMVNGENLKGEEDVEFPDANTRFDTVQRIWVSDLADPLNPYYQQK